MTFKKGMKVRMTALAASLGFGQTRGVIVGFPDPNATHLFIRMDGDKEPHVWQKSYWEPVNSKKK